MTDPIDPSKSLVEIGQQSSSSAFEVATIAFEVATIPLSLLARRRESSRLSRVARTPAVAPVTAVLAGWLAAEVAELSSTRAFHVVAGL